MSTYSEPVRGGTLENGLTVRLLHRPYLHTVSMGLFLRHGSSYEDLGTSGISHFVEHLLWNPRHMPAHARAMLCRLIDAGAHYEAYTSKEYTRFMMTCLPAELELALAVIGTIMAEQEVGDAAVDDEREVILHEHAMSFTSSRVILSEVLDNAIWGDRSLGLFVIGRRENIERLGAGEIRERLWRFYTPERSCLTVVGPVDEPRLLAAAAAGMARWRRGDGPGVEPGAAPDPRMLSIPQRSTRVDLLLGFPAPASGSPRRWGIESLADLLGRGGQSRLFLALRERSKLAYLVRAYAAMYRAGAYIAVHVNCEARDVDSVFAVLEEELALLRREGATPEEMTRVKGGKAIALADAVDDHSASLQLLGLRALFGEDFAPQRELDGYLSVTPDEVEGLARELLHLDDAAVVARGLDSQDLERIRGLGAAGAAQAAGGRRHHDHR